MNHQMYSVCANVHAFLSLCFLNALLSIFSSANDSSSKTIILSRIFFECVISYVWQ
jgi:hypothetical protein